MTNVLRRFSQWGAIALVLLLAMLSRGSVLLEAYGAGASHVARVADPWEAFLYRAFSAIFGGVDGAAAMADRFQGSYWSITVFGVTINDPLAALGHAVATGGVHWPLIVGVALPVVVAVVAGRFFCGWICPVNTLLELNAKLRGRLEKWLPMPRMPVEWLPPRARWLVLTAAVVVSAVAGFNAFAYVLPYAALARDSHLAVWGQGVGFGVSFLAVLVVVELLWAPRIWCRSLCPTGLLLQLFGRRPWFAIRRTPAGQCVTGCHACIAACPVGVNPRDQIDTDRCLLCNTCVDRCPTKILTTAAKPPSWRRKTAGRLGAAAGLLILALLPAADAQAHHIKGLPHYGYLENYPQTPTRERLLTAPPYRITVVVYASDGFAKKRGEASNDAMIYVSIVDTRTGKPYVGALRLTITPDGGAPQSVAFERPLEETVYRTRAVLRAPVVEIAVAVDGVVASTRVSLDGGSNWGLVATLAFAGFAVAATGIAILRRRRRRLADIGGKFGSGRHVGA